MNQVYLSCREPGLAPVNPEMHDFGFPKPLSARPGSGEPKCLISVHRRCREPVSPSVNQKCMISVHRSCQEPGLAPVTPKMHDFGSPELPGPGSGSGG